MSGSHCYRNNKSLNRPLIAMQNMIRGERSALVTLALLLIGLSALVNEAGAENRFPTSLDDSNLEEEARYGVISLTGATSNTTLNLSGIVLLGMSLSAAVSMWAYSHNLLSAQTSSGHNHLFKKLFNKLSPSTSPLNYTVNLSGLLVLGLGVAAATMFWSHVSALSDNRLKRSTSDDGSLAIVLNNMHRRFERAEIYEMTCRQRIICEIGAEKKSNFPENSFAYSVNSFFGSVNGNKMLMESFENHKRAKSYLMAWNEGKGGKMCKTVYDQCSMTNDSINKLIKSSE
ncbi:Uncharacterized protein APZ42_019035 [Daphnia magna]|uniref:Uncharacterized protein n=1 Tax=Daphnia magna TaxID=35525 RepID=A0A162CPC8_9CRUS|nr:Uncharacterized protein APZ42_019035 [Daphnia magna]